jgi:orotate phosphoribosyltransferase
MLEEDAAMNEKEVKIHGDPLETLKRCGGYYECPKDTYGKRLGPLVAYRGTYQHGVSGEEMRYVGDVYFNFAQAEQYPHVLEFYASHLTQQLTMTESDPFDVVVGAPMGGMKLSGEVGRLLRCRAIYAEKKEKAFVFDRYAIRKGDRTLLVEDVCNNFSTTASLCGLVKAHGGEVVTIVCAFNRAGRLFYQCGTDMIPVKTTLYIPTVQYQQGDLEVFADMRASNVVWDPKTQWTALQTVMKTHSPVYQG